MVAYQQNELISSTELVKKFSHVMRLIKDKSVSKIGVLKNNKLEAVVISTDEYERLKALEELHIMQKSMPSDLKNYSAEVRQGLSSTVSELSHKEIFDNLTKRYAT